MSASNAVGEPAIGPRQSGPSASVMTATVDGTASIGELPRRLGVPALVLMIVAFNAPIAAMAGFSQLSIAFGNHIGAPISFLVAGAILLLFSVGFVGMSRYIDNPGAFYRFIVAGIGRPSGLAGAFLATAAYLLLSSGSYPYMGLVAVDFATRLTGGPVFPWQVWTGIFLLIITALGLLRIDLSMKVLGVLVCLEVAMVAIWQAAVLIGGGPEGYSLASYTPAAFMQGSPGMGILLAMLCMIGIEAGACFRAEVRDPERAVGRATYFAIVFLAFFYSLGVWLYIVTQGASHAVHSAATDPVGSFFNSVQTYLGGVFVHLVSLVLVTSQMAALNSVQGSASRYLYALGRDGVLPRKLGQVHSKLESPHVAVLTAAGISLVVLGAVIWLRIDPVAAYGALSGMGIYFLVPLLIATSSSVILFYRRNRQIRTDRWTRLIAPALAAVALTALFALTSLNLKVLVGTRTMTIVSLLAVAIVPASGFFLALFYRARRPATYALIGNL